MKKIASIYLLFQLLAMVSYAQTEAELTGKILSNKKPLSFASISMQGTSMGVTSNLNGSFSLKIPAGNYKLIVSLIGYEEYSSSIDIKEGERIELNINLKETEEDLPQVTVTGTLKETFVTESPVKVEVITAKFLEKSPTNNIMEAIQTVNGVQEQINCGVCNTSDIHINGMEGPYTLVLIDGMPIMSSLSTVYGLNGIPTSLIDRIEIIKGPSSTLYGSEAVAGVINVITKKPGNTSLIGLNTFATSDLEKNVDFSFAPSFKYVQTLFSGNFYHMDNFIDRNNDNFSDVALSKRLSLFNKWNFQRKENRTFSISAKYYKEDRYGGVKEWTKADRGSDKIYGESIYTDRIELISSYQLPITKEKIRLDISFNDHIQDSYYGMTKYNATQQVYFMNLLWDKRFSKNHDGIIGLTGRYLTYNDNTPATVETDKRFIPGVFIQDEITLTPKWKILGGIRYDFHKNHGNIFSPAFNLKWKPATYTTLRLNAGTGFRVVNLFTEEHAALTGARTVVIAEKLNPEKSYNSNLNINHILNLFNTSVTLDADIFYTYFTNKIIPNYEIDQNLIYYQNLSGYSVSRGISLSVSQAYRFPLRISLGTTLLDVYSIVESESGQLKEPQLFAPAISGVFNISYNFKKIKTSIDYTGKIMGPMHLPTYAPPFQRPEISESFSIQNVQITHLLKAGFELYYGAKNLLNFTQNSPLVDPANPFSDNFDTAYNYGPTQGRRYFVGLRWNFY